jgi:general secretion pathway protein D
LIIVDRARNVKKLQELIQSLDVDYLSHVEIELVQVENDDAADLAKEMDALFKTSQIFNWRGTEANKVFFLPIKRMNAILIAAANKEILESAKRRVKEVDIPPKEGVGSRINIYVCKNSGASYLASIISQIYGGPAITSADSSSGLSSSAALSSNTQQGTTKVVQKGNISANSATGSGLVGEVQVIPNEKSNSLIIKAGRQDYLQILKLLEQLDTVPRQVLIQANIIEVTLSNSNQLGLEWQATMNHTNFNGANFHSSASLQGLVSSSSTSSTSTGTSTTGTSTTGNTGGGLLFSLFDSLPNAIAQIQAVASDNDINVLSSPRILASDGKEATIEVGEDVPVLTQSVSTANTAVSTVTTPGTTVANSVNYRSVGLILKIKPNINDSGLVNLALSQEVSNIVDDVNQDGTTPRFTKRKIDTEVTLQEGKTLTIGGLIQDQQTKGNTGIPFLKDIPWVGNLFKSTSKSLSRTELLLTLTPYVIRSQDDTERVNHEADELMDAVRAYTSKMDAQKAAARRVQVVSSPNATPAQ